ncbi:MAG: GAF domain-containing protein [Lachnospiraceae bacterium]|nr:GAF domain-containing protein [Lachnospiraceae bacterium]
MYNNTEFTDYETLRQQVEGLLDEEPWYVAAMSNISALIMTSLDRLNWAGFYIIRDDMLVVGPFQGKPACIRIPVGKGVCGTAIKEDRMQVVPDVHKFPGHIACDSASESEIVIPIHRDGKVAAVLDIDSPVKNRFGNEEADGLSTIVELIEKKLLWN